MCESSSPNGRPEPGIVIKRDSTDGRGRDTYTVALLDSPTQLLTKVPRSALQVREEAIENAVKCLEAALRHKLAYLSGNQKRKYCQLLQDLVIEMDAPTAEKK